jgi:hypothetical protein
MIAHCDNIIYLRGMLNNNAANGTAVKATLLDLDSKYVKSFATEETLIRKMDADNVRSGRYQIVRTPRGRWTALVIGFRQELIGTGWPIITS